MISLISRPLSQFKTRSLMDRTRSTLLMKVRDPADGRAWGEFVHLYEPLLTAYVRKRGLGEEDTRDVVQDVFARLVKTMPEFRLDRQRGRFRTWLWQICQSALGDWARRRRREARAEHGWLNRLSEVTPRNDADSDPDWELMHRERVLSFALETVRKRSRPRTWACFDRHVLQRRPSAEVAIELGLTANNVDVNSSRILDRIREMCAEYLEELADGVDVLPAESSAGS
jgi:RNA polymerase sigma-70 factor (ECF subfamily)